MGREITPEIVREYEVLVKQNELEPETIRKYLVDAGKLQEYLAGTELTQEKLDIYPKWLLEEKRYKKRSINSIVVSTRKFCQTMGWNDLIITGFTLDNSKRTQRDKCISRSDYEQLLTTAMFLENYWLAMLIQTLCHMDIRYSELSELTVEAVRRGYVQVTRRQKRIVIDVPDYLAESLLFYAEQEGIAEGIIFRSSGGKLYDRSNAWRDVKSLCKKAGLDADEINMQRFKMPGVSDYYPFYPIVCFE